MGGQSPGAATRTFGSADGTEHELLGWDLLPDTAYAWSIGGSSIRRPPHVGQKPRPLQLNGTRRW